MSDRPTYGGQAVMEGVMIRGQRNMSVAVRRPDGSIALLCTPLSQLFTGRLRRVPLLRGVIALIETLTLGMRALSYSANVGVEAEGEELSSGAVAGMIGVALVFGVGLFFVIPVFASRSLEGWVGSDLVTNVIEGIIRLGIFLGYFVLIGRMEGIRRVFMYHGAEHMTVHAQERGDPLDVESVRKYATAHPRCGTAFLLVVMVIAVVAFVFVGREPLWWLIVSRIVLVPVIAAAAYEVIRLSGRYSANPLVGLITRPSLALQSLTTRQPDDDQIEIAIAAMTQAIDADEAQVAASDAGAPGTEDA